MRRVPQVSVLMPVFNAEKYLQEAIQSILQQSFADFEFICVDDGSVDSSNKIIRNYMKNDSRIVLIEQSNQGIVSALNKALFLAKGKYCARMDADDISHPNRLAWQFTFLEAKPDVVVVGGQGYIIDSEGDRIRPFPVELDNNEITDLMLKEKPYTGKIALIHPAVLFRTAIAKNIGGYNFEYQWAEDLDFFLRMGECGQLANLDREVILYRQHGSSITDTKKKQQDRAAYLANAAARVRRHYPPLPEPVSLPTQREQRSRSTLWISLAISAANNNHYSTAIKNLRRAVTHNPFHMMNPKVWWVFLLLLFPSRQVQRFRSIRRMLGFY